MVVVDMSPKEMSKMIENDKEEPEFMLEVDDLKQTVTPKTSVTLAEEMKDKLSDLKK